jgi:hypothetical protein
MSDAEPLPHGGMQGVDADYGAIVRTIEHPAQLSVEGFIPNDCTGSFSQHFNGHWCLSDGRGAQ